MTHWLDRVPHLRLAALLLIGAIAQASCNSIDDDLSDCGIDAAVTYDVRLLTNMDDELATVLGEPADQPVATALRNHLSPIFNDRAHDLGLAFYQLAGAGLPSSTASTTTTAPLYLRERHIIDARQAAYTLYLPLHHYQNLALANLADNSAVTLSGADDAATVTLASAATTPHTTGLFTARLPMDLSRAEGQRTYHATLYMANSAAALVIDTTGVTTQGITVTVSGLADAFNVNDSTYTYDKHITVSTQEVKAASGHQACYCTVAFPSPDSAPAATRADATAIWTVYAYVDLPNGTTTRNVINVYQPLRAACLKIIKVRMQDDGSFQPVTTEVGVSTSLNWRKGGEYEV